ncbi:MAG: hypothetical protein H3C35_05140 [Bacteroidetes bacterium]|nr:hypothetical protein [Bacteroidota bacterium]
MSAKEIICPACNRKYFDPPFQCVECGTELGWRCASCNFGNYLYYRFCGKCGTPIPVALLTIIAEGKQMQNINLPQYNETALNELMEESQRLVKKKEVKNLSQSDLDSLFE